ncbi:hypothetical protein RJ640_006780 [Escallonia rubra]|uniref:Uncharacterized protein n=1 Tax=Escallonia rubra TaxID=112253 RepID=A0AA88R0U5_9ASTE|nr:hypothetical protein RJ640_006780 [Escallonia rubra]
MGIIRSSFSFMLGTICGVYIAQNYNVPNIMKLADMALVRAKQVEQTYRKPDKNNAIVYCTGYWQAVPAVMIVLQAKWIAEVFFWQGAAGEMETDSMEIDYENGLRHRDLSTNHGDRTSLDEVGSAAPPLSIEDPRLLPHPPPSPSYLSPLHESTPSLATALETDTRSFAKHTLLDPPRKVSLRAVEVASVRGCKQ